MTSDDIDRIVSALEPGWLDWLSGLAVPILLGFLTLFVALRSNRVAKEANALAQKTHRTEREASMRTERSAYASILSNIANQVLEERRATNISGQDLFEFVADRSHWLHDAGFIGEGPSAAKLKFARWIVLYAENAPIDDEQYPRTIRTLASRTRLWITDPSTALKEIRRDPMIPDSGLPVFDPTNEAEFRV